MDAGIAYLIQNQRLIYRERDGKLIADNTQQFDWIAHIYRCLKALFYGNPNVFVAADLLWYPVKGYPGIRTAPDGMVAFGRPSGDRGNYRQWEEGNIAPQVIFEVLSPKNTRTEMIAKRFFYERYGVEEYYEYDPGNRTLKGWIIQNGWLEPIAQMNGWTSPRLKLQFTLDDLDGELNIYDSEGRRFITYLVVHRERKQAEQLAEQERQERLRAEQAEQEREQERQRAEQAEQQREQERQRAEQAEVRVTQAEQEREQERQRAEQAEQQREQERKRAEKLLARLRAEGINLDDL